MVEVEPGTGGGGAHSFPDTPWSRALSTGEGHEAKRKERLLRLCTLYWRPVYGFIRRVWRRSVEDTSDLTQDFFRHILEGDFIDRHHPDKGRFRLFLKGTLRNYLAQDHRDGARLKRGGGVEIVPLADGDLQPETRSGKWESSTPEEIFDRQWRSDLVSRSLVRLKDSLEKEGKEIQFRTFHAYELAPREGKQPTYAELSAELGIETTQVRNYLHSVRARLQQIILETVSEGVTSADEALREMEEIFS